jgi:hypothetical protein
MMKYVWIVFDISDNEDSKDLSCGEALKVFDRPEKAIQYVEEWMKKWIGEYRFVLRKKKDGEEKIITWRLEYLEKGKWVKQSRAGWIVRRMQVQ